MSSVSFSGDGSRIVSGSSDKTVRVWDAVSGECVLGPLEGHTDLVRSVSFSADGRRVVSGSLGQDGARVGCRVGGMRVGSAGGAHELTRCRFLLTAGVWCPGRGQDGARVGCGVGGMRVGAAGGAHELGDFGVDFC